MENKVTKQELEAIMLQTILAGAYTECGGCRVYQLENKAQELVIKNLNGTKEVETLTELEDAVNSPNVKQVYIGKYASVTSKGLKAVMSRTSLTKNIFCAFSVKE